MTAIEIVTSISILKIGNFKFTILRPVTNNYKYFMPNNIIVLKDKLFIWL